MAADVAQSHPKGIAQAYSDIAAVPRRHGFERVQGSVYMTGDEDLTKLFRAVNALKRLSWFPDCVRDIRAFRVEQRSDFTPLIKEAN